MTDAPPVLLVDDDDTFRGLLVRELQHRGYEVIGADSVSATMRRVGERAYDVAVVDMNLPDGDGLDLVLQLRQLHPQMEVIVLTGHGSIDSAVEAMRRGAFDYLRKPCPIAELEVAVNKALEHRRLLEANTILRDGLAPQTGPDFVGASPHFAELTALTDRVARTDATALILGETGVGKDVVVVRCFTVESLMGQFQCLQSIRYPLQTIEQTLHFLWRVVRIE